jgi:hypothetical protein
MGIPCVAAAPEFRRDKLIIIIRAAEFEPQVGDGVR